MTPHLKSIRIEKDFSSPEATTACFFNSILGHTRNWPRAFSCLAPEGRNHFDSRRGLMSFADYWEDLLCFLEEFVKKHHRELPYTHRTCFSLNTIQLMSRSDSDAVVSVGILENHLASERMSILQLKQLAKHGQDWLLINGKLEGDLDDIIGIRSARNRKRLRD